MAGIEFTRRKLSEAKNEVPQLQEFRRRFIGPAAELLNLMASILSKPPFNYTGTDVNNNIVHALVLAAMRGDGLLEFIVDDEIISLDISQQKLGNFAGLLSQLRDWNGGSDVASPEGKASEGNAATVERRATPEESAKAQQEWAHLLSNNADTPAPAPIAPELTDEDRALMQSVVSAAQPEPGQAQEQANEEAVQPEVAPSAEDDGDSKNQLHMELEEATGSDAISGEQPALESTEGSETPAQTKQKRAIPDFHARMRNGEKS